MTEEQAIALIAVLLVGICVLITLAGHFIMDLLLHDDADDGNDWY